MVSFGHRSSTFDNGIVETRSPLSRQPSVLWKVEKTRSVQFFCTHSLPGLFTCAMDELDESRFAHFSLRARCCGWNLFPREHGVSCFCLFPTRSADKYNLVRCTNVFVFVFFRSNTGIPFWCQRRAGRRRKEALAAEVDEACARLVNRRMAFFSPFRLGMSYSQDADADAAAP